MAPGDLAAALAAELPREARVAEVHCWALVTAARCERWGLASTRAGRPSLPPGSIRGPLEDWSGRPVREAAAALLADGPLAAAAGAALVSAALPPPEGPDRNVRELLRERARGRRVALVGAFPFAPGLAEEAADLQVIELEPDPSQVAWEDAAPVLARAELVCATGGTLLNGTLPELLTRASGAEICLVGPTVPPARALLDLGGVSLLAGVTVERPELCLPVFRRGGPHRGTPGLRRWVLEAT